MNNSMNSEIPSKEETTEFSEIITPTEVSKEAKRAALRSAEQKLFSRAGALTEEEVLADGVLANDVREILTKLVAITLSNEEIASKLERIY